MIYGCIGKKLGHSFSKEIHSFISDYSYELEEIEPENLENFMLEKDFSGINVTIPYKQDVMPYLDEISEAAQKIGAVNTIVNKNGKLLGFNTDFFGMKSLIERNKITIKDKKALILGTGGTSKTAYHVLKDMGAKEIIKVSRSEKTDCVTYEEVYKYHTDAEVIINTTPSGMYPSVETIPLDIENFKCLEGVIDTVYNPLRSNLVLEAQKRGIKAEGGLYMLVAQAVFASELFLDTKYDCDTIENVFKKILAGKENIVLTGMPGSGKSTVGKILLENKNGFYDSDEEILKVINESIKDYIEKNGEEKFRKREEEVIEKLSLKNGVVISTGGGSILKEINVTRLKRNGKIVFLDMPIERIVPTDDRPLSNNKEKLYKLYDERIDIYKNSADYRIEPVVGAEETAVLVKEAFEKWKYL